MFEANGGHRLFLDNPIQRAWRDVPAMRPHAGNKPEASALVFARSDSASPPPDFRFSTRKQPPPPPSAQPATQEPPMVAIRSVAHFSIPVSDLAVSIRF